MPHMSKDTALKIYDLAKIATLAFAVLWSCHLFILVFGRAYPLHMLWMVPASYLPYVMIKIGDYYERNSDG